MIHRIHRSLLLCLVLLSATAFAQKSRTFPKKSVEVCSLLTSAEIESVLGEAAKQAKSSTQPGGGLLRSGGSPEMVSSLSCWVESMRGIDCSSDQV